MLIASSASAAEPNADAGKKAMLETIPVVVVDEAHHALDNRESPDYEISPSDRITIDTTGYNWKVPANAPKDKPQPDTIQIVADGTVYSFPWKPENGKMTLPAAGGMHFQKEAPFRLEAGMKGAIGIGLQTMNDKNEVRFTPFWFAGFLVK